MASTIASGALQRALSPVLRMLTRSPPVPLSLVLVGAGAGSAFRLSLTWTRSAAATFGCLVAAQHSWSPSGANYSFADAINCAMATVGACA